MRTCNGRSRKQEHFEKLRAADIDGGLAVKKHLLALSDAAMLSGLFKVLANDTRLRILHALACAGEMCMTDLAGAIGMKPQAVSNQLQRLFDRGVLCSR